MSKKRLLGNDRIVMKRCEEQKLQKRYQITFAEDNTGIEVPEGSTIREAMLLAGKETDFSCGGQGTCGKCWVRAEGRSVLACQTKIESDLTVTLNENTSNQQEMQVLTESVELVRTQFAPGRLPSDTKRPLLAAIDVGTTTIAAYLLDGSNGEVLCQESMINPQKKYGADVIERCNYALQHGKETLSSVIRDAIQTLLKRMTEKAGGSMTDLVHIMMVGNTAMHHLFLEFPVRQLALAPYQPFESKAVSMPASECGISAHPEAVLSWLPNLGGFVGADTTGCILSSDLLNQDLMTLIIDIGTNGELVLGSKDTGFSACATAAGPAFEGARIACGMRACPGAIDHVSIENQRLCYHTIGGRPAIGICGSGLLDAVSCMLKTGLIDETGRLEEDYYFTEYVYLTQKDIRELQLAKAAIAAGIDILCAKKQITAEEISQVLLAGAFGSWMDPESAFAIGLLPDIFRGKVQVIGNAAGEGAKMAVRNAVLFKQIQEAADKVDYIELASERSFQEIYVEHMDFPDKR